MIRFGSGQVVEALASGAVCVHCEEPFNHAGGVLVPSMDGPPAPMHRECVVRLIAGGVNHQRGTCSCHGGPDGADPPSLTRREAARVARTYLRLHERSDA